MLFSSVELTAFATEPGMETLQPGDESGTTGENEVTEEEDGTEDSDTEEDVIRGKNPETRSRKTMLQTEKRRRERIRRVMILIKRIQVNQTRQRIRMELLKRKKTAT